MSTEGNHPASEDTAQTVFPVTFFKDGDNPTDIMDWRPEVVPSSAPDPEPEEEVVPKDESAQAPVPSPESPKETVATVPESPVQPPADEVTGPPKVESPGQPASSDPTTPGKAAPPAKTPTPAGSSRSAAKPR